MGLFLTMMACKGPSRDKVIEAIKNILSQRGLYFDSQTKVDGITGKNNLFEITNETNGWIQVFGPEVPDDKLTQSLSEKLNVPVFQFHIHDGDLWMYELFVSGKLVDRYNPTPDYWSQVSDEERNSWKGNSKVLSSVLNIQESSVKPYLIPWTQEMLNSTSQPKAFPEDEFNITSEWAMVDFQKKLGIEYPPLGKPEKVDLVRLTFSQAKASNPKEEKDSKKPKWKFW